MANHSKSLMSKSFRLLFSHKEEKCCKHPGKPFTMGCETCMSPDGVSLAVCVECAVNEHKGHNLCTLEEIIAKRQESLCLKIARGEAIGKKIEEILKEIKDCETNNNTLANGDCNAVRKKADELKDDIDHTVSEFEKNRKSIEKRLMHTYTKDKESLSSYASQLKDRLHKSKNHVNSNKVSKLIDAESDLDHTLRIFSPPDIEHPFKMFMPSLRNLDHIKRYLGTFLEEDRLGHTHYQSFTRQNSYKSSTPARETADTLDCRKSLKFDFIKEVYSFKHSQESIRSLSILSENAVWVCRESVKSVFNDLKLVNNEGDVEETVFFSTSSGVMDIYVNDSLSLIASCKDQTIRQITPDNKDNEILFSTESVPNSICQVSKEEFVICSYEEGEVAKYNIHGEKLCFLARQACAIDDGDGYAEGSLTYTPIITYPYKIRRSTNAENREGGVLAVCNHAPSTVVIMDFNLNVVSIYHGQRAQELCALEIDGPIFEPMDICFGDNGNIFIADGHRNSIIMLDSRGSYLKDVRVTKSSPSAIVAADDTLWIGYITGKIEVIKYGTSSSEDWDTIEEKFAILNTLYHPM